MADRAPYSLTVERTDDGPRLVAAASDGFERTFTTEAARG